MEKFGIKVVYKEIENGALGYFDQKTNEICIDIRQSKMAQDVILIHEFLHATASALKQYGVIKRMPDHDFITNASQQLLGLFVESGKWSGIKKEDVIVSPH